MPSNARVKQRAGIRNYTLGDWRRQDTRARGWKDNGPGVTPGPVVIPTNRMLEREAHPRRPDEGVLGVLTQAARPGVGIQSIAGNHVAHAVVPGQAWREPPRYDTVNLGAHVVRITVLLARGKRREETATRHGSGGVLGEGVGIDRPVGEMDGHTGAGAEVRRQEVAGLG